MGLPGLVFQDLLAIVKNFSKSKIIFLTLTRPEKFAGNLTMGKILSRGMQTQNLKEEHLDENNQD